MANQGNQQSDTCPATATAEPATVLVTGATGHVGGHLVKRLEAAGRYRVRCVTRQPEALAGRVSPGTVVLQGDALHPESMRRALDGVDTAYYLVHSMSTSEEFAKLDRSAAANFAVAAQAAGVRRLVYLGGLGNDDGLSPHLASRHEVGAILRSSGVQTLEFRASIVIGAGSASYEIVRALVESLPVVIAPSWLKTTSQPIAIEDLLDYLLAALDTATAGSAVFEIGGADRVSYAEILREYARQRGLRRRVLCVALTPPGLSQFFLGLITPGYRRLGSALVDSLRNETVVDTDSAVTTFPIQPAGLRKSIERALRDEDYQFAQKRWSTELVAQRPGPAVAVRVSGRVVSTRAVRVSRPAADAFAAIQRIGGGTGWYAANWFWRARGWLDRLRGGVGLRRGRRHPVHVRVGDAIDFWRVERFEPGRLLLLAAEMKLPGRLWLQFEVQSGPGAGAEIRQTTVFDPAGFVGRGYWYLLRPVHRLVFSNMLQAIGRATADRCDRTRHRSRRRLR